MCKECERVIIQSLRYLVSSSVIKCYCADEINLESLAAEHRRGISFHKHTDTGLFCILGQLEPKYLVILSRLDLTGRGCQGTFTGINLSFDPLKFPWVDLSHILGSP